MVGAISALKRHIVELSDNPDFIHRDWFVEWHLKLVERISLELADCYPQADRELLIAIVWMHDYGKLLEWGKNEAALTQQNGFAVLKKVGFDDAPAKKIMHYIDLIDKKVALDRAPIEVQIVSSADGCSHLVGPFMSLFWYEFSDKPYEELMAGNLNKAKRGWESKVVLPEAREAFQKYYDAVVVQNGELPKRFIMPRL